MPSVSVLPSSPAHRTFGAANSASPRLPDSDIHGHANSRGAPSLNGVGNGGDGDSSNPGPGRDLTVAEIKDQARSLINGFRGASAISLLRSARDQAVVGASLEAEGDLKGAYRALLLCAQLSAAVLKHAEFIPESQSKQGLIWHEWEDFEKRYGMEALTKAKSLETKLLEVEKEKRVENDRKPGLGGSIADRIKSLQDTGLKVETNKRISRDLTTSNSTAAVSSPVASSSSSMNRFGLSSIQNGTFASNSHASPSVTNHQTGSSVQSLASPSVIGPSSPPAPSYNSPHLDQHTLSEFNHTFPSIDELDEGMSTMLPSLPSVPKNKPGLLATVDFPPASPSVIQRFPSLPLDLDPGPRPASTPISPTMNVLTSQPPSPSRTAALPQRSPLSPAIPPKPVNLTMTGGSGSAGSRTSPMHTGDSSSLATGKAIELPKVNAVGSNLLHDYLGRGKEVKVLLLDVRTRDEFSKGHIKSGEVVCLEPHVLLRDGLTWERLEDALAVAPQHEAALFRNRDKFDLVVMYDWDSETFGSSLAPMSAAVRIIYETAGFKRALKRPPAVLVGGFKAWLSVYPNEITREDGGPVSQIDMDLEQIKLGSPTMPNGNANGSSFTSAFMLKDRDLMSSSRSVRPASSTHPRSPFAMDQIPEDASSPTTEANDILLPDASRRLVRKPAIMRPPSSSSISFNIRGLYDTSSPYINGSNSASSPSITYPQYPRTSSSSNFSSSQGTIVSPPPTASINPSLSRRRSDYIDQSEQAVSSFTNRPSIDYPDLSAQHVVRPPPAVATPPSERQDQRRVSAPAQRQNLALLDGTGPGPRAPTIKSEYPVLYWPDMQLATSGLKNLGNTCYMNSTIQCLSATVPFARFFIDGRWKSAVNFLNPMGTKGRMTAAFASILHDLWHQESPTITPYGFRKSVCMYGQQFAGSEQHDCQEFLNFLLDGLHEDLNRILNKEPIVRTSEREAELETLPQQIASQQEWNLYRMRDDSIVVDFFQGQFRNRMECMTCRKTSTTYNSFMYLTLPIPSGKSKVTLQQCLDAFVQEEVMEKEDAWQCPNCKTLRKATKKLSISRLPPVLLIHLKRFTTKGHFTDKLETFVDFPLKSLDLTNYMPAPLPPGVDRSKFSINGVNGVNGTSSSANSANVNANTPISLDDPRSQVPPYRYDLYAVTNHFGTLSSGHYTAFVSSRGSWLYCDDSRIANADAKEVVGKPAYVLYYKRVKA